MTGGVEISQIITSSELITFKSNEKADKVWAEYKWV